MKTPKPPIKGAPVTADWGREVSDALARHEPSVGPGLLMRQTPQGTVFSLAAKPLPKEPAPMPFDLRLIGGIPHYWAADDSYSNVTRNANRVVPPAGEGWVEIAPPDENGFSPEGVYFFVVYVVDLPSDALWPTGYEGTARYTVSAAADYSGAGEARKNTATVIGGLFSGNLIQWRHGSIDTFYAAVDSDCVAAPRGSFSLGYTDYNELMIWDFLSPTILGGEVLDSGGAMELICRGRTAGDLPTVKYVDLQGLVDQIMSGGNDDPYGILDGVSGILGYDGVTGIFEKIPRHGEFWECGDNETTCYGSMIGDSAGVESINIDGGKLLNAAAGEDTLDWRSKLLDHGWKANDHAQGISAHFGARSLYDIAGTTAIDWDDRVLLDAAQMGSINWGSKSLIVDGVTRVSWENFGLYDTAENLSVDWGARKLYGDWTVAAGGSIDTPAFKYGGVVYAPETLAIVTGVAVDPVTHAATLTTVNKTVLVAQS